VAKAVTLRVLVTEDDPDTADSLKMLLEEFGYEVHVSSDGESAVTAALALKPHVILMDIGLPGISGYDAARRIRAWKPDMPVRIVALTGRDKLVDRQRSAEAGIDHHLVKPADPAVLQRIFDSTLAAGPG
jgi:CheY-like chemotaxis protein